MRLGFLWFYFVSNAYKQKEVLLLFAYLGDLSIYLSIILSNTRIYHLICNLYFEFTDARWVQFKVASLFN